MRLAHGRHLAYCPDVPRDGSWKETFAALRGQALAVRDRVCRPGENFGICLRLGHQTVSELQKPRVLARFLCWLGEERCEVFTLDDAWKGEGPEASGWTRPERLAHTCRMLDLLGELLPEGSAGSVSTAPSRCRESAEFSRAEAEIQTIYANFIHAAVHAAEVSGRTGRRLSLALGAEGSGLIEDTAAAIRFLEPLIEAFPDRFGVCLDTGQCAYGFEEVAGALAALDRAEIPVVKMRLSSVWSVRDGTAARAGLRPLVNRLGPCPVAVRRGKEKPIFHDDLCAVLMTPVAAGDEWRVYGPVPMGCAGGNLRVKTVDERPVALDWLAEDKTRCPHLEMEVYSWENLEDSVTDEITRRYDLTLGLLAARGLA